VQVVPLHAAPLLFTVSHIRPQPLQFVMLVVCVSQPFVFGAVVTQSPQLPEHEYEHVVPLQLAVPCVVSHTRPQPLQFEVVLVGVSHPLVLGAAALQSPQPPEHEYEHVVPLQLAVPCVVSHTRPQPLQFVVVLRSVSQPLVFGATALQSPHPAPHEYEHVVPLQLAVPCV
jgi:hypothetical protein